MVLFLNDHSEASPTCDNSSLCESPRGVVLSEPNDIFRSVKDLEVPLMDKPLFRVLLGVSVLSSLLGEVGNGLDARGEDCSVDEDEATFCSAERLGSGVAGEEPEPVAADPAPLPTAFK